MDNKSVENHNKPLWQSLMVVVPSVILLSSGCIKALANSPLETIAFSAILGGLTAGLGMVILQFVEKQPVVYKALASIGLNLAVFSIAISLLNSISDDAIVAKEWIPISIGSLTFESPQQLSLQAFDMPSALENIYDDMKIYIYENQERGIVFYDMKLNSYIALSPDMPTVQTSFEGALEGMLNSWEVDLNTLETTVDSSGIFIHSAYIAFTNAEERKINGYGYLYRAGTAMSVVLLMPKTKGFSDAYIEKFRSNIKIATN